jgi:hypothetical protein
MDQDYAAELVAVVEEASNRLHQVPSEAAARRPSAEDWSIQEVIGHLIDSALNNQRRFVLAQWTSDLIVSGYDPDAWVATQRYREAPWPGLVDLWRELNLHVARTMTSIPVDVRMQERREHNLDEIAFHPVPTDRPTTLDYLMRDYVVHLKHHLAEIWAMQESITATR